MNIVRVILDLLPRFRLCVCTLQRWCTHSCVHFDKIRRVLAMIYRLAEMAILKNKIIIENFVTCFSSAIYSRYM